MTKTFIKIQEKRGDIWTDIKEAYADIISQNGQTVFRVKYRLGIVPTMRVIKDDEAYEITAVKEPRSHWAELDIIGRRIE